MLPRRHVPAPTFISSYLAVTGNPAVIRGRMAAAVPLLALRRDARSWALGRALSSAASARVSAEEREWMDRIERRRAELAKRETAIEADFAPGADGMPSWVDPFAQPMAVDGISVLFSIPSDWGRLLMRLVSELSPRSCLELGTAFGISASYQAAALELNGAGRLVTMDAAREWGSIAEEGFRGLSLGERVDVRIGQIADTLPAVLEEAAPVDFVFLDAEHQEEPTLEYFELMLPYLSERAVVVFDDIGFPQQMRRAWKRIKRHRRVSLAVGLGRIGIVCIS